MAGSRERERRRARERFEKQREVRRARQRAFRKRFGIGLAVVCVLGLIGGITAAMLGGSTPAAAKKPKATRVGVSIRLGDGLGVRRRGR